MKNVCLFLPKPEGAINRATSGTLIQFWNYTPREREGDRGDKKRREGEGGKERKREIKHILL